MNISKIKQNPVRDYRTVEKRYTTIPCIPSGMQPLFCNEAAFLQNAGIMCEYNFLPSDIPYGNRMRLSNIDIKCLFLNLTAMASRACCPTFSQVEKRFNSLKNKPSQRLRQEGYEPVSIFVRRLTWHFL